MANPTSDPFAQGIPTPIVLRLLSGRFSKIDYRLYRDTPHWKAKRLEALAHYGRTCIISGLPGNQVHHTNEGYRFLFREDVVKHLRVVSAGTHRRIHGK